ncbi:MAG: RNA polymerase sigma factor [Calditrichia bacterium]
MNDERLAELIKLCLDKNTAKSNRGWVELKNSFSDYVHKLAWEYCKGWKTGNLPQLVNEFASQVWTNVYKSLHTFEKVDNVAAFVTWLRIITKNTITAYWRRYKKRESDEEISINDIPQEGFNRMEFYEEKVEKLRAKAIRDQGTQAERDIHIFYLAMMREIHPNTVWNHPCIGRFSQNKLKSNLANDPSEEKRLAAQRSYIQRICYTLRDKLRKK